MEVYLMWWRDIGLEDNNNFIPLHISERPVFATGFFILNSISKWIDQTNGTELLGDWKTLAKGKFMTAEFVQLC